MPGPSLAQPGTIALDFIRAAHEARPGPLTARLLNAALCGGYRRKGCGEFRFEARDEAGYAGSIVLRLERRTSTFVPAYLFRTGLRDTIRASDLLPPGLPGGSALGVDGADHDCDDPHPHDDRHSPAHGSRCPCA